MKASGPKLLTGMKWQRRTLICFYINLKDKGLNSIFLLFSFVCFSTLAQSYFHWKYLTGARQHKPFEERGFLHQTENFSWKKCTHCEVCDRLSKLICAFDPSLFSFLELGVRGRLMTAGLSQEQIMKTTSSCSTSHLPSVFKSSRIIFYWSLFFPHCITVQLGS